MKLKLRPNMDRARAEAEARLCDQVSDARMRAAAGTPALQELVYWIKARRARGVLAGEPCPVLAEEARMRSMTVEALARAIIDRAAAAEGELLATELVRVKRRLAIRSPHARG